MNHREGDFDSFSANSQSKKCAYFREFQMIRIAAMFSLEDSIKFCSTNSWICDVFVTVGHAQVEALPCVEILNGFFAPDLYATRRFSKPTEAV